ncbi:hypothetical protein E0494_10770 [Marinilabiliaceae bacterium JC040]|nr:hypothetical protein [Marinilabiliaceae bacterium JC040]
MNGSSGKYEYNICDHLGNVRAVVDDSGELLQQNDYYPFGGVMSSFGGSDNKYLYNGKELQEGTDWFQNEITGDVYYHSDLASRYISKDLVLNNTLTLGTYKNPQYDSAKRFGPMYSIRNQSWIIKENVYGKHVFGSKFGKIINTLQKVLPWKSAYENILEKVLK